MTENKSRWIVYRNNQLLAATGTECGVRIVYCHSAPILGPVLEYARLDALGNESWGIIENTEDMISVLTGYLIQNEYLKPPMPPPKALEPMSTQELIDQIRHAMVTRNASYGAIGRFTRARSMGLSYPTISNIIRGKRPPSERSARILREWLINGKPEDFNV